MENCLHYDWNEQANKQATSVEMIGKWNSLDEELFSIKDIYSYSVHEYWRYCLDSAAIPIWMFFSFISSKRQCLYNHVYSPNNDSKRQKRNNKTQITQLNKYTHITLIVMHKIVYQQKVYNVFSDDCNLVRNCLCFFLETRLNSLIIILS